MALLKFRDHPVTMRVAITVGVAAVGWMGYRAYGLAGIALAAAGLLMWVLLNMTRMLLVLRRTAQRPVGAVASAVMLHARLEPGMTLLQVLELTRALGQREGDGDPASERYRWTDGSGAQVHCAFEGGRLIRWELLRT